MLYSDPRLYFYTLCGLEYGVFLKLKWTWAWVCNSVEALVFIINIVLICIPNNNMHLALVMRQTNKAPWKDSHWCYLLVKHIYWRLLNVYFQKYCFSFHQLLVVHVLNRIQLKYLTENPFESFWYYIAGLWWNGCISLVSTAESPNTVFKQVKSPLFICVFNNTNCVKATAQYQIGK